MTDTSQAAASASSPANSPLQEAVLEALDELKANDVKVLDVSDKTAIADMIVVASGTSGRHIKSLADAVVKAAKEIGVQPLGVEGVGDSDWVLVDIGDIIVHVMSPHTREFYGLERLWNVGSRAATDVGPDTSGDQTQ